MTILHNTFLWASLLYYSFHFHLLLLGFLQHLSTMQRHSRIATQSTLCHCKHTITTLFKPLQLSLSKCNAVHPLEGRFIPCFMSHFFVSTSYDRLFLHLYDYGTRSVVEDLLWDCREAGEPSHQKRSSGGKNKREAVYRGTVRAEMVPEQRSRRCLRRGVSARAAATIHRWSARFCEEVVHRHVWRRVPSFWTVCIPIPL